MVTKKDKYLAAFYIHDIANNKISWFGEYSELLGRQANDLDCLDKFIKILSKRDKENYSTISKNPVDEFSCEYAVIKNKKSINLKEVAIKTNHNGTDFVQGIITASDHKAKPHDKYGIFLRSILGQKINPKFLEELKTSFVEGKEKRQNNILMVLSVDNYTMIYNWQGEEIAEELMVSLCKKIEKILPEKSNIKRIRSEQIGVIVSNPVTNEVDYLVNQINRIVNLHKNPKISDPVHLRLSIGSVYFPLGVKDDLDAVSKANLALASVKNKENCFYCDFEDAKRDHIDAQNEMMQLHHLQKAYNDEKLVLAFQPIISSADGSVLEYETLLRIDEGNGKYDSAGRFIPIAEKMGTVEAIDELVLSKVVEEIKNSEKVRLAINISNLTTTNDNWHRFCSKILSDEKIASRISIEITETAAQKDLRKTAYFTASMQALGCRVALDDFGVGFTSFRQLRSLSVDYVKIDGSYILGLEDNRENLIFIKSLIDFNKSYGLKTIAECIENGEVAKKLMDLGVDYMQGYYFGKPEVQKPWESEVQSQVNKPLNKPLAKKAAKA